MMGGGIVVPGGTATVWADRTNRILLTFTVPIDAAALELGEGTLNAADKGPAPALLAFEAVAGEPLQLRAVFDGRFRPVSYTFAFSVYDAVGSPIVSSVSFVGIERSAARILPADRRLKVDLDLGATVGGDGALLAGDNWIREQVARVLSWRRGELLSSPTFGRPFRDKGPLRPRELADLKRDAERIVGALPGVVAARVLLEQRAGDQLAISARVQTSQSSLDVSVERLRGK